MRWRGRSSKDKAKERLKLVLAYDRLQLAPGLAEALKHDLLEVLRRYFPLKDEDLRVSLEERGKKVVLVADIPLR